jgi:hypothetical protein
MSHWAELDENNTVVRVLVGSNDDTDEGYQWLVDNLGGTWLKTSYNGNIRKNFAGIDYTYDPVRDAFIPPTPFPSWVVNEETCLWQAPVEMPVEEGKYFTWNEEILNWDSHNVELPTE